MTFDELKSQLEIAAQNGTLLTPKHDPNNLGIIFNSYRTVLSKQLAKNLESFIGSGKFTVRELENKKNPDSPLYFEITPNQNSEFNVPASGVTAASTFATSTVDKIIAVSGKTQGWHLFGENSSIIQTRENNGDLIFKKEL